VAEDALLGQCLGFLHHGLQLLDQDISIELAGDLGPQAVDGGEDDFALGLLKQLWQSPGPVEPSVLDLDFLAVIGRDDVIHGPDVAAWVDPDSLP